MTNGFLDDLPDLDILRKRRRGWRESIPAESYFPKPRFVDYLLVRRKLFNALRNNEVRGELQAATKRVSEESGKYDEKLNWEEHRCLYIWTSNASRLVDDSDLLCCLLAVYYDGVCGLAKKVVADELKSMDQYVCECLISFIDQQKQAGIEILLACAEEKGLLKPRPPKHETVVKSKKSRISREEANVEARKILKKNHNIKARDLAKKIPCSIGLVSKLPVWKAVQEQRKQELKKGRKAKKVRLTKKMLKIAGTGKKDETLNRLIVQQQADIQEDDRQAKLFLSEQKKPLTHD